METKEEISYEEALKLLGVKRNTSRDEVNKIYKNLAKKYHPDVNKEKDSESKFKELNLAYSRIKLGPTATPENVDYKHAYGFLKNKVNLDADDLDEEIKNAGDQYTQTPEFQQDIDSRIKLERAKEQIRREIEINYRLQSSQEKQRKKWVTSMSATPKQKQEAEQKKQRERDIVNKAIQKGFTKTEHNINKIIHTHQIKNGKAHIPIMQKEKGRTITKIVAITSTILAAIIAGKIIYDHKQQAFRPITGYITQGGTK